MLAFDVHPDQNLIDLLDRTDIEIQFGCVIGGSIQHYLFLSLVRYTLPIRFF